MLSSRLRLARANGRHRVPIGLPVIARSAPLAPLSSVFGGPSDGPPCARSAAPVTGAIVSLLLVLTSPLAGQQREIRFDRIDHGLSQGTINAMLQDSRGMMWFGTQDGLNRFDGYSMEVFKNHPENPASLPSNHVWSMREDDDGDLWIGTEGGVVRWVRSAERFERVRLPRSVGEDGVKVRDVWRHGDDLWIASESSGLVRRSLVSGDSQLFDHHPDPDRDMADEQLLRLLPRPEAGELWIGSTAGLHRLDLASGSFEAVPLDGVDDDGARRIRDMTFGPDGRLWLATYLGLVRFDPRSGEVLRLRSDADRPSSLTSDIVRALHFDHLGRLWVGTEQGLDFVDAPSALPEAPFAHYRAEAADLSRLANPRIFSLYQDRGGVLWVGTQNGLHKWHPRRWTFGHYRHDPQNEDSLASNAVTSFSEGPGGEVWVGTLGGGLDRWDRDAGVFHHYTPGDGRGLGDPRIMSLLHDRRGRLWVGTYRTGLFEYAAEGDRFVGHRHREDDPRSLSADAISVLYEDRGGELWVGTFGGGLNRFDPETGEAQRFQAADDREAGGPGDLSNNFVTALAESSEGLWVGTTEGLDLLDPESGEVTALDIAAGPAGQLPIMSLHVDPRGVLWIGTKDAGLARLTELDRATGEARLSFITESDGLPNSVIYSIYSDENERLWVSTNKGLSRVDIEDLDRPRFANYDASHGLQEDEFNFGAHHQSADGEFFFGGFNGFNAFHPANLAINENPPPVALTSIKKLNRPVDFGVPLEAVDELTLDHRDPMVSFEFAALDFASPENNRYAYRLQGFDREWIELGEARRVTYTNLNPGRYTLRVKAANGDGIWNEQGLSLPIHVVPAPWRTWWAYSLYLLAITGTVFTGVRMRIAGLKRNERRLESMVDLRTRELESAVSRLELSEKGAQRARHEAEEANKAKSIFLSSMSHELRTPLNAVIGFSQLLRRDRGLREGHRKHLNIILRSGEHLLGLINDVLSLSKIEAGKMTLDPAPFNIRRTLSGVVGMMQVRAERAGVGLVAEPPEDFPEVVEGDEKKLRQVLLNLLSNAVKFTAQGGQVTLRGRWLHGVAFFEVHDTGSGISRDELEHLFSPFTQTEAGRRAQEGTGLGLTISRDFVQLMGGEIEAKSEVGVGSIFSFHVLLPAAEASDAPPIPSRRQVASLAPGEPEYRVVVADDKSENRLLLCEMLRAVGFEVREAEDGVRALELWRSFRPHVIWTDLRMPEMDGQQLIREIRRGEAEQPGREKTVLLVLTATVLDRDRQDVLDLGADGFLVKPFAEHEIFDALETHLGASFTDDAEPPYVAGSVDIDAHRLGELPADFRRRLHDALAIGDIDRANELVADGEIDAVVRGFLQRKLAGYEIESLIEKLAEVSP